MLVHWTAPQVDPQSNFPFDFLLSQDVDLLKSLAKVCFLGRDDWEEVWAVKRGWLGAGEAYNTRKAMSGCFL